MANGSDPYTQTTVDYRSRTQTSLRVRPLMSLHHALHFYEHCFSIKQHKLIHAFRREIITTPIFRLVMSINGSTRAGRSIVTNSSDRELEAVVADTTG